MNNFLKTIFASLLFSVLAIGLATPGFSKSKALRLTDEQVEGVRRINDYINSFQTLKSKFVQVSAKGNMTQGTLYIAKPGRLRFDYTGNPLLIISDGRWLTMMDRKRMRGDQFPIANTPLRLVVSPNSDLLAETDVIAYNSQDGLTSVSLQEKKPGVGGGGYITLIYDEQLKVLQQWIVVDSKGRQTSVQLSDIEFGGNFDPKLFVTGEINK